MNFGDILDSVTHRVSHMIFEANQSEAVDTFRSFTEHVKARPVLHDLADTYNSFTNYTFANESDALSFIGEEIQSLKKYTYEDITIASAVLGMKFAGSADFSPLNESIDTFVRISLMQDAMAKDFKAKVIASRVIAEHLVSEKKPGKSFAQLVDEVKISSATETKLEVFESKHVVKRAIRNFNRKYMSAMSETDKAVFEHIRSKSTEELEAEFPAVVEKIMVKATYFKESDADTFLKSKFNEALDALDSFDGVESSIYALRLLHELDQLNGEKS